MSSPKHHEFVNDLDYRKIVSSLYDENISMSSENAQRHDELMKSNLDNSFTDIIYKNSKTYSDIYNHVLGYTDKCDLYNYEVVTTSCVEDMFSMGVEYERLISSVIRKFATIYSLDIVYRKNGEFNDPVFAFYDQPKNRFVIVTGQQRYFYSKIFQIPIKAYVYSQGNSAADDITTMFPEISWKTNQYVNYNFMFKAIETSDTNYNRMHLEPTLSYDKERNGVMEEFQNHVLEFMDEFVSYREEVYYYCGGRYIAFVPNKFAVRKKKIQVKDVYGIFQHALWKYRGVEEFALDTRFSENEF